MRQAALDKANDDPQGTAARILDAAEAIFAEVGYAGTSTREVARRARVPFGALHYHWGSKKELFEAVLARVAECLRDTLARSLPSTAGSPGETLDRLVDAFVDVLAQNRNGTRLLYRYTLERYQPDPTELLLEFWGYLFQTLRDRGVTVPSDGAPMLVLANAFVACVVDELGQRVALEGDIRESPVARERLLVELRRLARSVFRVPA